MLCKRTGAALLLASSLAACAASQATEVLDLPRQILSFQPTRGDITVGKAVLSVYSSRPQEVLVNGVRPDSAWQDLHLAASGIAVDSRIDVERANAWFYIDLPPVGTNRFELAPLKIGTTTKQPVGFLCVSLKVWFHEVPNERDALYYQDLDDRYSLVSYCTSRSDHPPDVQARFGTNPVATADELEAALARPFVIRLNQRPLREE